MASPHPQVYFPSSKDVKEWIALGAMAPKDTDQPFSFFKEVYTNKIKILYKIVI